MKEDNTQTILREAQLKMLEGLIEIDRICQIHKIDYWLDAGTLLGAIRHGGFIPWDDDIDICMTREDFNRFVKLSPSTMNTEKFFLQTPATDPYYINVIIPCKFRINSSFTMVEEFEEQYDCFSPKAHHGLFVDIFPYDKYSQNKTIRKLERILSIGYRLHRLHYLKDTTIIKKVAPFITYPFTRLPFLNWLKEKQISYMSRRKNKYLLGAGCETPFSRAYFSNDEIFPLKKANFEGISFSIPNQTETYLIKMFGENYMSLPPKEDRKTHGKINKIDHSQKFTNP